ncbi:flagellar biosynthesis repressor FlbT [Jiella sp. M17.18]|uniref:flagellar biosynthesis repressor FlbT n=1 Tax=Jiella sp. M17.18 TaxID=3234247 RepID=UPI0034DEF256
MATLRISLRAGERIFVNGAVLKVDRKTTLEFLNDVTFLLESHVLQAEQATTPLRQLYFIIQMILMDPDSAEAARKLFAETLPTMLKSYSNRDVLDGLLDIEGLVERNRSFEALKRLRTLIPIEDDILEGRTSKSAASPQLPRQVVRLAAGA